MLKKIVFLSHPAVRNWGSNWLRCHLMAALARRLYRARGFDISVTEDAESPRNALVIAHKGYMAAASPAALSRLRAAGNIVVADWLDSLPARGQLRSADALMACAHAQAAFFEHEVPGVPVFHVTHIVDPRIPDFDPPAGGFRPAYFGARTNGRYLDELYHAVAAFDTAAGDLRWLQGLSRYNCHYAVRNRQALDGFKPFTKGFIAARCKSPVIVLASEDDALHYLTGDYPYLVNDPDLAGVAAVLARAAADFGGPRWRLALSIMADVRAKCTARVVAGELERLVTYFGL